MSTRRKWLRRLIVAAMFLVAVWLALSFAFVYRLTRRMNPLFAERAPTVTWKTIETVGLTTEGNHTINGWFVSGQPDQPVVLILHGNGACRSWILDEAKMVVNAGYGAMLISMRAHGDSTGDFNDIGYGAQHDVVAAVRWLQSRDPERKIVIWGQSMGSAAALFAGEQLGTAISGYILEMPYQDLKTAVWIRLKQQFPPVLSHAAYAGMVIAAQAIVPHLDDISPEKAMAKVPKSIPMLIMAGSHDPLATMPEAEALLKCSGPNCRMVAIPTNAHIPALRADRKLCEQTVLGFLKQVTAN